MMRRVQLCVTILILAWIGTVSADEKKDQAMIQGTWQDDVDKDATVVVEDDTMKLMRKKDVLYTIKYQLDSSKSPKTIDLTIVEGEGKGGKMPGIYKFDGQKLVIAYALPSFEGGKLNFDQPRPKSFPAMKSPTMALLTMSKVKKE
jgi:uncharacterized protein (TIGR03067 family)